MSWRKSWPKLNIYGHSGNGNSVKRSLLPDERSVWDDYLDLAQISPVRGEVCIASGIGYTTQQLSQVLQTTEELIVRAEERMKSLQMISILNRVITINKWSIYQSEYSRQLQYRDKDKSNKKKLQPKVTTDSYTQNSRQDTERDTDIDIYIKKSVIPSQEDFLTELQGLTAYKHVNLSHELAKMDAWLAHNPGRKKTKRFVLNWLNKIEAPLETTPANADRGSVGWKG